MPKCWRIFLEGKARVGGREGLTSSLSDVATIAPVLNVSGVSKPLKRTSLQRGNRTRLDSDSRHRGSTLLTDVGTPGEPPAADAYSGTPTHVNSRASRDSPNKADTSLSMNVIPEALAPWP